MTDIRCTHLIENLKEVGVKAFVICAGSRNSALTLALLESSDVQLFNHFEEREASFFALGLSKRSLTPVCVVTTSGTAASELLPACIEAYYSGVPLIMVTADRPARYRTTGAPQAIEQSSLFGEYCRAWYDVAADEVPPIKIDLQGPSHINICFEEPASKRSLETKNRSRFSDREFDSINSGLKTLDSALKGSKSPLVILGEFNKDDSRAASAFCSSLGAPVFAETLSGLRESSVIKHLLINGSERVLQRSHFDCIIRIGSVPLCRYWRDLEYNSEKKVISIDSKPFSGMPAGELIHTPLTQFFTEWCSTSQHHFSVPELLRAHDDKASKMLHSLIYSYPQAEPSLMYQLSHVVHEHDALYLGNSLPIREWDLAASRKKAHPLVMANRGANGIDGQISTFLGSIDRTRHNWGVFGDLTTLYGLSSLWASDQLGAVGATLCIINNGGGKIFERVGSLQNDLQDRRTRDLFVNSHKISFEHWAKMWNLPYQRLTQFDVNLRRAGISIAEIIPDESQTASFWAAWDEYWKSA